jgi:hypothetical protein
VVRETPLPRFGLTCFREPHGRALVALCEQLEAKLGTAEYGSGSAYFRLPAGSRLRVADHAPIHPRSMAAVRVYVHPRETIR